MLNKLILRKYKYRPSIEFHGLSNVEKLRFADGRREYNVVSNGTVR
jgi:hypothetical protein